MTSVSRVIGTSSWRELDRGWWFADCLMLHVIYDLSFYVSIHKGCDASAQNKKDTPLTTHNSCNFSHDASKYTLLCAKWNFSVFQKYIKLTLTLFFYVCSFCLCAGINSPGKFESITDIIHNKIEETDGHFLIGHEEEKEAPNWSTLFDGSQSMVLQKSILSQSKTSTPCSSPNPNTSSTSIGNKKRRAPPPPSEREPYAPPTRPARPPLPPSLHHPPPYQEKENSCTSRPATRSKTGRPSLDAKFSAIIQQLQRNNTGGAGALSRKNAPLGVLDVQPQSQPPPPHQQLEYQRHYTQNTEATSEHGFVRPSHDPVPAPRSKLRKSFRERMNLKAL